MKFTSETEGELILFELGGTSGEFVRECQFVAPLRVSYSEDSIIIEQLRRANSENSNTSYNIYEYRLFPDTEGLISCVGVDQQVNGRVEFKLKKVE